ncbi:MAG: hypothetical protein LBG70_04295, partial [Bifidobacteriaceae bacterium]|nr:hypothetical protein [Bifidobacteriaceae bacterium]
MSYQDSVLDIAHLYPSLMGTYGDGGNVAVLAHRLAARGIVCRVLTIEPDQAVPRSAQMYVIGGGEDHGQVVAARLLRQSGALTAAVAAGAVVFAVCAGLQVIGVDFAVGDGRLEPGLGLLDLVTRRREPRAVGEVWAVPDRSLELPDLTGYENHGGASQLGPDARPLAYLRSGVGNGDATPSQSTAKVFEVGVPPGPGTEG